MVSATAGVQLARIAALASRAPFRRSIIIGTAMMPAIRQPKNATMNSDAGRNTVMARSPTRGHGQSRRERARGIVQLSKAEDSVLRPAIGDEDIGAVVGLLRRTPGQQCHERAEGFHGLR